MISYRHWGRKPRPSAKTSFSSSDLERVSNYLTYIYVNVCVYDMLMNGCYDLYAIYLWVDMHGSYLLYDLVRVWYTYLDACKCYLCYMMKDMCLSWLWESNDYARRNLMSYFEYMILYIMIIYILKDMYRDGYVSYDFLHVRGHVW